MHVKNVNSIFSLIYYLIRFRYNDQKQNKVLIRGFFFVIYVIGKFIRGTVHELLIIFQKHQREVQQTIYITQQMKKRRNNCGTLSYLESNISYTFLSYLAYLSLRIKCDK